MRTEKLIKKLHTEQAPQTKPKINLKAIAGKEKKMTFDELIKKLKELQNGSEYMIKIWYDELPNHRKENINKLYGFIRALYAVNFISEDDEKELIEQLYKRHSESFQINNI